MDLKENAPLHPLRTNSQANMSTLSAVSQKRKMIEDDKPYDFHDDPVSPKNKKPKLSALTAQPAGKVKSSTNPKPKDVKEPKSVPGNQATDDYPNGFFYCHQCTRKRDTSGEWLMRQARVTHTHPQGTMQMAFIVHSNMKRAKAK